MPRKPVNKKLSAKNLEAVEIKIRRLFYYRFLQKIAKITFEIDESKAYAEENFVQQNPDKSGFI